MTADTPDPRPVSPPTAWEQRLLDGIRDEVAAAVLEGDAQDCSSAVCIADAVYEIVRVRLRDARPRPAMEADAGLLRPWLRHKAWCNCKTDDPPDTKRCKCGLAAALAASPAAPAGLDEFVEASGTWGFVSPETGDVIFVKPGTVFLRAASQPSEEGPAE